MQTLTIGIVQWLPVPGQGDQNTTYACEQIASLQGSDLIVLPELWPNACSGETAAIDARSTAESLDGPRVTSLSNAARRSGSWVLAGSVTELVDGHIFNTALLFNRSGELVATHRKVNLYTPLGEHDIYAAGSEYVVVETDDIGNVGIATCFDADFPETARQLAAHGATIVTHPSAYEVAAEQWWDTLYPAHALANGVWWVSVNQCGTNGGVTQLGASRIISPNGVTVYEAVRAADGESPAPVTERVNIEYEHELITWQENCAILRSPSPAVARQVRAPQSQS
jgi:predicted amidohydrolase